jgi:hypothetical protein
MKRIGAGSIAAVLIALGSCSYLTVGDNAVRVRGELVQNGAIYNGQCTLELRLSSMDSALKSLPVSGAFDRTFTVSPQRKTYYVAILCPDFGQVYRSEAFDVKDTTYLKEPLNLRRVRVNATKGLGADS